MKILLDSHTLLWALRDSSCIPDECKQMLIDDANEVYYSPISIYEFAIKRQLNKDVSNITIEELIDGCVESAFQSLPLRDEHVAEIQYLKKPDDLDHKDPFDRLLLCQAKSEDMRFMTHDSDLKKYNEDCIIGF